jgi:hypothetical protein
MKRLILCVALFLTIALPASAHDEICAPFKVKGSLLGYRWANSHNKLALFVQKQNTTETSLHILDVAKKKFTNVIPFKNIQPKTLAWLRDDSGFVLTTGSMNEPSVFYILNLSTGKLKQAYQNLEMIYSQAFDVEIDSHSSLWAVSYVGEGHPDVAVYDREKMVFSTDVFPGSIETVAWKNGKLFVYSTAYLELGLTRKARNILNESDERYMGRSDAVLYSIDPATQKAERSYISLDSLQNISFDRDLYVKFAPQSKAAPDTTTFMICPISNIRQLGLER